MSNSDSSTPSSSPARGGCICRRPGGGTGAAACGRTTGRSGRSDGVHSGPFGCAAVGIAAVRDRPCAGDDDDAGGGADSCLQRDEGVVDDENAGLVSDAAHDAANDGRVLRTVDAGDAEADGGGNGILLRHRFFHHGVQNLLELQLAHALEIGAGAFGRRHDPAFVVAQKANGLCAADVDAKNVHEISRRCYFAALTDSS